MFFCHSKLLQNLEKCQNSDELASPILFRYFILLLSWLCLTSISSNMLALNFTLICMGPPPSANGTIPRLDPVKYWFAKLIRISVQQIRAFSLLIGRLTSVTRLGKRISWCGRWLSAPFWAHSHSLGSTHDMAPVRCCSAPDSPPWWPPRWCQLQPPPASRSFWHSDSYRWVMLPYISGLLWGGGEYAGSTRLFIDWCS